MGSTGSAGSVEAQADLAAPLDPFSFLPHMTEACITIETNVRVPIINSLGIVPQCSTSGGAVPGRNAGEETGE